MVFWQLMMLYPLCYKNNRKILAVVNNKGNVILDLIEEVVTEVSVPACNNYGFN